MYKRILVPIDGSQTSTRALVAALQMARESAGAVRLIHVIEELTQVIAYDPYGAYPGDLLKVMRDNGMAVLGQAMEVAKSAGVDADQRLVEAAGQRLVAGRMGRLDQRGFAHAAAAPQHGVVGLVYDKCPLFDEL